MKTYRLLAVALLLMATAACNPQMGRDYYEDYYTMQINRYPATELTYDTGLDHWSYSGDMITAKIDVFFDKDYSFQINLRNNTDGPLAIDWNRVTYVDTKGQSFHVIHHGVDYWQPVATQTPTLLAPGEKLNDLLRPAQLVHRDGAVRFAPLDGADVPGLDSWPQTVVLLVPVHFKGEQKVYHFRVSLEGAAGAAPDPDDLPMLLP